MSEKNSTRVVAVLVALLFPIGGLLLSYLVEGRFFGLPLFLGTFSGLVFGGLQLLFPITHGQASEQRERLNRDRKRLGGAGGTRILIIALSIFALLVLATTVVGAFLG